MRAAGRAVMQQVMAQISREATLEEDAAGGTHGGDGAAREAAIARRMLAHLCARLEQQQTQQLVALQQQPTTSTHATPARVARHAREYLFELRRFLAEPLKDVTAAQAGAGHGLPPAPAQLLGARPGDTQLLPSVARQYEAWHASYAGKARLFDPRRSVLGHLDDQAQCLLAQLGYPIESLYAARSAGGRDAALHPRSPLAPLRRVLLAWLQELTHAAMAAGHWMFWLRATGAAAGLGGQTLLGVTDALSALSLRPVEELVVDPRLLSPAGVEAALGTTPAPVATLPDLLSPRVRERLTYCERSSAFCTASRMTQHDNLVDQTRLDAPEVQAILLEEAKEFKRAAGGIARKCARPMFETLLSATVLLDARDAHPALLHPVRVVAARKVDAGEGEADEGHRWRRRTKIDSARARASEGGP